MAISVVGVQAVAGNKVRVQFSEPFNTNRELYRKDNYVFRVRFGDLVDIFSKVVEIYDSTHVDVTLADGMLKGGQYELTVRGVSAVSDSIPIESGAGPQTAAFEGSAAADGMKVFDIRKRVPGFWKTSWGTPLHALLGATGTRLEALAGHTLEAELSQVARALSVRTAEGADLSTIGQNFGVSRPPFVASNDTMYRQLLPIFGTRKKAVLSIFYEALTVALGSQEDAGWRVFEVSPNVLDIEIPGDVFFGCANGCLASATYFHADAAETYPPSYQGDYLVADASVSGPTLGGVLCSVITFQNTVLTDILLPLKAAGIQINIHVLE